VTRIIYMLKRNCVSKSLAKSAIKRQLKICEQRQLAIKMKLLLLKLPNNRIHHLIEADLSVLLMSALGHKPTFHYVSAKSAFTPKAEPHQRQ
jgi:hypothetical protein